MVDVLIASDINEMEKKQHLIKVATALFIKHGLISVTMDELAKASGMSKKTVYKWFANKDKVIGEVVAILMEQAKDMLMANTDCSKDPVHELILQKRLYDYFIALNFLFNDLMLQRYPHALSLFDDFRAFHKGVIELNLSEGIAMGLYRPELSISTTTRIYLSATHFFLFKKPVSSVEVFQVLMLFVYGIVTGDGRQLIFDYMVQVRSADCVN